MPTHGLLFTYQSSLFQIYLFANFWCFYCPKNTIFTKLPSLKGLRILPRLHQLKFVEWNPLRLIEHNDVNFICGDERFEDHRVKRSAAAAATGGRRVICGPLLAERIKDEWSARYFISHSPTGVALPKSSERTTVYISPGISTRAGKTRPAEGKRERARRK